MMSKQEFVRRMRLIQNFRSEQETLSLLVDKITDGMSIVTIGDYLIMEIADMIEESLDLKDDELLDWWLYEDVEKVIYDTVNNVEISVRTLEELYDYTLSCKVGDPNS